MKNMYREDAGDTLKNEEAFAFSASLRSFFARWSFARISTIAHSRISKFILVLPLLASLSLRAQQDSVELQPVTIKAYLTDRAAFTLPASAGKIDSSLLGRQPGQSLLPAVNTIAGVRMEERSPASYRLSIRGSLLRSPFGVRNVKMYLDEFPFTDAGGNTYLNLLDPGQLNSIEILKGPDGSLFGTNSGGVVRLGLWSDAPVGDSLSAAVTVEMGSWGTLHQLRSADVNTKKHRLIFRDAWMHSDGYRHNSAMERKTLLLGDEWAYRPNAQLRAVFFYTRLDYQTPGGLTLAQYEADPRAARPATATLPGAEEQRAGVSNDTWYAGLLHDWQITPRFRHVVAFSASQSDFENPFITNYETRKEATGGVRTWLEYGSPAEATSGWKTYLGGEGQFTSSHISNYDNRYGLKDTLRARDNLLALQEFVFARFTFFTPRWQLEAGTSLNFTGYVYRPEFPQTQSATRNFAPQWMPRVAVSWLPFELLSLRAGVSRGYSPPTLAEVRASDNMFNPDLQPERGWSYEAGVRFHDRSGRLWADVAVFHYRLEQAIVRRLNDEGEEYFVNAGGTEQPGLEAQLIVTAIRARESGFFRHLKFRGSFACSPFKFSNYTIGATDYSGNALTGVPGETATLSADLGLPLRFYFFAQYACVSDIPLNDANTVSAEAYHLVQLKTGSQVFNRPKIRIDVWLGIDNLLNSTYSLGNDLNAAGSRYYNAAPPRSVYAGVRFGF